MDIRFLGQSCFELSDGNKTILIDPFLTGNPLAAAKAEDLSPDYIFLTHGHADHYGDTIDIAKRAGSTVVAIVELAGELEGKGVENVVNPNFGGTVEFDGGWVRLVPAWHTAVTNDGTAHMPAGLVINFGSKTVYHLGDTCMFSDLALPGKRDAIDVALVPIGGHFTMDRYDAVEAVKLVGAQRVIPCHYNTFPPIEADAEAFKRDTESATNSKVVVLNPGDTHTE